MSINDYLLTQSWKADINGKKIISAYLSSQIIMRDVKVPYENKKEEQKETKDVPAQNTVSILEKQTKDEDKGQTDIDLRRLLLRPKP